MLGAADPAALRWSDLVAAIAAILPPGHLTVWCDEDTPLLWSEILRTVAGHDPATRLDGADDFPASLMSPEGGARFRRSLAAHPGRTQRQHRRIVAGFLAKFARPDLVEVELDLPGWTAAGIARLTALYDEDVARIAAIPGVRLLLP